MHAWIQYIDVGVKRTATAFFVLLLQPDFEDLVDYIRTSYTESVKGDNDIFNATEF